MNSNWTKFLTHENKLIRNACKQAIKTGNPPTINTYLNLTNSPITELPEGLIVDGSLNLARSKIIELPKNLKVGKYLDLYNTKITKFPEGLEVKGSIYIDYWQTITNIPQHLKRQIIKVVC